MKTHRFLNSKDTVNPNGMSSLLPLRLTDELSLHLIDYKLLNIAKHQIWKHHFSETFNFTHTLARLAGITLNMLDCKLWWKWFILLERLCRRIFFIFHSKGRKPNQRFLSHFDYICTTSSISAVLHNCTEIIVLNWNTWEERWSGKRLLMWMTGSI